MPLKVFQKGFNYSQDGYGNRLVYHLQGCNLKCPWCSNPEGMEIGGSNAKVLSDEEIIGEVLRCKPMFFDGGGVTFTGGEISIQMKELAEVLRKLKAEGIHTAIETNGTLPNLKDIFGLVDQLIMDFKHPDTDIHRQWLGLGNETIKANLKDAAKLHPDLLVRIPLVNGFNADEATMDAFIEFFKSLESDHLRIELLRYHEYGKDKWKKCGKEYTVTNGFVPAETYKILENKIKDSGLNLVRT